MTPQGARRTARAAPQLDLADPEGPNLARPLPLAVGSRSPLLTLLRRLPFGSRLVPSAAALPWEVVRTYRIKLQPAAGTLCGTPDCFEAQVLDVLP